MEDFLESLTTNRTLFNQWTLPLSYSKKNKQAQYRCPTKLKNTVSTSVNNESKFSQTKMNNNTVRNEATLRAMYTVEYESE